MPAPAELALNAPVTATVTAAGGTSAGKPLQGVVAHLGPVQFSPDADWVGVRLTGPSVGLGRNDGSVKGVNYFECSGDRGGVFVKRAAVEGRTLTRLEELRLKRELRAAAGAGAGAGTDAGGAPAAPTGAPASASASAPPAAARSSPLSPSPSARPPPPAAPAGSARSRLDEIRERRAALQAGKDARAAAASPARPGATPRKPPVTAFASSPPLVGEGAGAAKGEDPAEVASLRSQVAALKDEIVGLQAGVRAGAASRSKLESALSSKESELHASRERIGTAEARAEEAEKEAEEVRAENSRLAAKAAEASEASEQATPAAARTDDSLEEQKREFEAQIRRAQAAFVGAKSDLERRLAESIERNDELDGAKSDLERRLAESIERNDELSDALDAEKREREEDALEVQAELTESRTRVTQMRREIEKTAAIAANRGQSEHGHLKERARLEAEALNLKRAVTALENDRGESEAALEELTLDKEALSEEKEALQDELEEIKIDFESTQVELEECRMELEEARNRIDDLAVAAATGGGAEGALQQQQKSAEDDDTSRTLAIQNSRLRDALIKLRDQSNMEKLELNKQLRTVQKGASRVDAMIEEVENIKAAKAKLEEEVSDLKEMVDQNSAFETMVEELSDRVMALEDDVVGLSHIIREMEEAAELAAEMEEVQTDELKATMLDLEGRDAVIRNLEEAIRMQRRREEDFQRTVSNYRTSKERLQQERMALLALQEGGEGERSTLIAKSQHALAKAASLVADAAKTRKKEADAAFDRAEAQFGRHFSRRLQACMPSSVAVSSELAALKGELMLSKVTAKASMSLSGVASVFSDRVQASVEAISDVKVEGSLAGGLCLSDEATQQVATVLHEAKFARLAIDAGSQSLRLLAAGQWPDILVPNASAELGAAILRSVPPVESALGDQLRILKEEGALSSHRSNLVPLETSVRDAVETLISTADAETGDLFVQPNWSPPGWTMLRDGSSARFDCLGAAAAVASAIAPGETSDTISPDTCSKLSTLLGKLDTLCTEASQTCLMLTGLPIDGHVGDEATAKWKAEASLLFDATKNLLTASGESSEAMIKSAETLADECLSALAQLSSVLRGAKIVGIEGKKAHALSPESEDPWLGITELVESVRIVDGDEDDINYIIRANTIESKLSEAIDSESKLAVAKNKVTRLEKGLVVRSKEISMQNARLSELEQMLAQSGGVAASAKSPLGKRSGTASEEIRTLKDENRMLTEAMDVLHAQVDEYEREIRSFKDPRKGRGAGSKKTPKKNSSSGQLFDLSKLGQGVPSTDGGKSAGGLSRNVALEAALFRPALQSARFDSSLWKAKAIESSIMNLPPINVPQPRNPAVHFSHCAEELLLASSNARRAKASFRVVDISKKSGAVSRIQLREELARTAAEPMHRLDAAAGSARAMLAKLEKSTAFGEGTYSHTAQVASMDSSNLVGRVRVPGSDPPRIVHMAVHKSELAALHRQLLQ